MNLTQTTLNVFPTVYQEPKVTYSFREMLLRKGLYKVHEFNCYIISFGDGEHLLRIASNGEINFMPFTLETSSGWSNKRFELTKDKVTFCNDKITL